MFDLQVESISQFLKQNDRVQIKEHTKQSNENYIYRKIKE